MKITVKITFKEMILAQDMGFSDHRELVALKFKEQGFAVIDFMQLRYRTYQDGKKEEFKIHTMIEGDVGGALVRL